MKGIILTMGIENTIGLDVAREHLKSIWGDMLLNPVIPRTISASYSVSECVPILKAKPQEKLSRMYRQLFLEVIARV
jgi:cellulose biosynthesis protein BcsQ